MFFHGAGERGNDNKKQLFHGAKNILQFIKKTKQEAIVVFPQVPKKQQWVNVPWGDLKHDMPKKPSDVMTMAMSLMDKIIAENPVDKKRIYAVGISMGGFGVWDIIQRRPTFFAAGLPICGGGDPAYAKLIKDVPVWLFHGGNDKVVKTSRSHDMVAALKKVGGNPKYTEYPGVAHVSWVHAFRKDDAFTWLFEQRKR